MTEPNQFTLAEFSPHVGTTFNIRLSSDNSVDVKLVEAEVGASNPDQFSLLFHDPNASVASHLRQSIYPFAHEQLGELEIFIVPVGPDSEGKGVLYEAVFS